MDKTTYCIACAKVGDGVVLWLGGAQDESGSYSCDVEAGPQRGTMEFWSVVPLPGTDAYYLLNETANLFACFTLNFNGRVALRPLDVHDPAFIVKFDHVADGWVAINNSAKEFVFDAVGFPPVPGGTVTANPWNGSPNQMWKLVDANIALELAATAGGKDRAAITASPVAGRASAGNRSGNPRRPARPDAGRAGFGAGQGGRDESSAPAWHGCNPGSRAGRSPPGPRSRSGC